MNSKQINLLTHMKKLVSMKKCRFKSRNDRDYISDLFSLNINEEEAWNIILRLNYHNYFPDPKPTYSRNSSKSLTFKRLVNNKLAYIKLELVHSKDGEETVCWSFHLDNN